MYIGGTMEVYTQICGLVILLLIIVFCILKGRDKFSYGRVFTLNIIVAIVSLILDMVSSNLVYNAAFLPEKLVHVVSKLYLMSLIASVVCCVSYIIASLSNVITYWKRRCIIMHVAAVGFCVLVGILPVDYKVGIEEHSLIAAGSAAIMSLLSCFVFLMYILFLTVQFKNQISHIRIEGIIMWVSVCMIAVVVQFIARGKFSINGFGFSLAFLLLFYKFENPDLDLDSVTGMYNKHALLSYVSYLLNERESFAVVSVFCNLLDKGYDHNIVDKVFLESVNYINEYRDNKVFVSGDYEIIAVYKNKTSALEHSEIIKERFKDGWCNNSIVMDPYMIIVDDSSFFNNALDVPYCLRYIKSNYIEPADIHYYRTPHDVIRKMYEQREKIRFINDALDNDRVEVYYQPIFSTGLKKFVAAEALVRLRNEDNSIVMPSEFIEIAEQNGLIIRLGETVFRKVCQFLSEHNPSSLGINYIEVNLSVVQCEYAGLANDYIAIMEEYHIDPSWINMEITESANNVARGNMLRNMEKLQEYGVKFSLDDFGTGHSNLNYIMEMPVDIVKFDRKMVTSYFKDGKAKYVMDAAMSMIKGMDMEIVSEGIEDENQLKVMNDLGIHYIQGFYFSKPLPQNEFIDYIVNNNNKSIAY